MGKNISGLTPLQAFKARCVPSMTVRLYAEWCPEGGELRTVHALRSKDVSFLRPSGKVSYLTFPKAAFIRQTAPWEFEIVNEGHGEILRYVFDSTPREGEAI